MNREIVLDTETTGLEPKTVDKQDGHKLIEIAGLELIDHIPTGKTYHTYINPERDVPEEARKIHGLTYEFLQDKPLFSAIEEDLFDFIGASPLIIHKAEFDLKFLEAEINPKNKNKFADLKRTAIDTLKLSRRKRPDLKSHSLDNLGAKLEIDMTGREEYHGALIDCNILALVYFELISGQKQKLMFADDIHSYSEDIKKKDIKSRDRILRTRLTQKEIDEHKKFIKSIHAEKNWKY